MFVSSRRLPHTQTLTHTHTDTHTRTDTHHLGSCVVRTRSTPLPSGPLLPARHANSRVHASPGAGCVHPLGVGVAAVSQPPPCVFYRLARRRMRSPPPVWEWRLPASYTASPGVSAQRGTARRVFERICVFREANSEDVFLLPAPDEGLDMGGHTRGRLVEAREPINAEADVCAECATRKGGTRG